MIENEDAPLAPLNGDMDIDEDGNQNDNIDEGNAFNKPFDFSWGDESLIVKSNHVRNSAKVRSSAMTPVVSLNTTGNHKKNNLNANMSHTEKDLLLSRLMKDITKAPNSSTVRKSRVTQTIVKTDLVGNKDGSIDIDEGEVPERGSFEPPARSVATNNNSNYSASTAQQQQLSAYDLKKKWAWRASVR